jgi:hypothetical protein
MAIVYGANYGRPTLDLNFAKNKSLIDTLTGRNLITFSRSSTATYVGADGLIKYAASGAARFDHNPATGESLGLLIEEARTNLNLNSAATYNGLTNITSNSFLAPDGTLTAATFQPPANSNSGGTHELYGVYPTVGTISVGNTVTVYARRNPGSAMKYLVLRLLTSGYINYYNLETGVVTVNDGSMPGSMTNVGNGWWRCQLTNNIPGGSTVLLRTFVSTVLSIAPQTNGDPIYLWGVQNEAGSFPTSYIPTSGSTVTRAADVASMTGTNFSSWYNQSQGTFSANLLPIEPANDGSGGGAVFLDLQGDGFILQSRVGSSYAIRTNDPSGFNFVAISTVNGKINFSIGLSSDGSTSISRGSSPAVVNMSIGTLPKTGLLIGSGNRGGTWGASGTGSCVFSRLTYYPVRLPDAQLQTLTAT